jgi:cold shock CspA family protein
MSHRSPGTVVSFDAKRGLGVIEVSGSSTPGTTTPKTTLWFHCTQLADGTRSVDVGASVRYAVVPGGRGCWEAAAIELA